MIELHKYERVHVYHTRSKCTHIYGPNQSGGHVGGGVLTTLRNNLAPEEGGGRLFEGGIYSSKYGIIIAFTIGMLVKFLFMLMMTKEVFSCTRLFL